MAALWLHQPDRVRIMEDNLDQYAKDCMRMHALSAEGV
jgi:hypothetical protein